MSTVQIALLLCALTGILVAAQVLGSLFQRMRQPAVIGEILAGLILGPTVFGIVAPDLHEKLLPSSGPAAGALQMLSQLGLLLLMFVTGGEMRISRQDGDRRTVAFVAVSGLLVPLAFGILLSRLLDPDDFSGPAGTRLTFGLVFGIAVAVTSIPVISRIMLDLNMLNTALARIVLSIAALEDLVLYAILALALSLAHTPTSDSVGLWALIDSDSTAVSVAYHLSASLIFFTFVLLYGPRIIRRLLASPANLIEARSPTAFRITLLLVMVLLCVLLGINIIFGPLLAGLALRRAEATRHEAGEQPAGKEPPGEGPAHEGSAGEDSAGEDPAGEPASTQAVRQFALAFFIPIYFVSVGLNLDLVRDFDAVFTLWFILLCSAVKLVSVWAGARLAGQGRARSLDLAMALNGRGGPGIVLATTTLAAGVINEMFFTSLVLLSVLTSQLSGVWLERRLPALRAEEARAAADEATVTDRARA